MNRGIHVILCASAALALLSASAARARAAEPQRILLIHSFGQDVPPFSAVASAFRRELSLASATPIEFCDVSLETARFGEATAEPAVVDYLQALYSQRRLDLIVALGSPAVQFVLRHRPGIFPSTPMLATGPELRRLRGFVLSSNDAAVAYVFDLPGAVQNILRLLPETTNLAVVLGASPIERAWREDLQRDFQPFRDRVAFSWLNDLPMAEMRSRLASLPPRSAIFFGMLAVDAAGVPFTGSHVLDLFHEEANAPLFGLFDFQEGQGIVGGALVSTRDIGHEAADIASRILAGARPADCRVLLRAPDTPAYDWRELRRWGIDEARLPAGSAVRFRPPPFWVQYRWETVAAAAALLLQTATIGALLVQGGRRRRLALALRQQAESLRQSERQFRGLYESMRDAFVSVDLEGRIRQFNAAYREMLGYSDEELGRMAYPDLTPERWHAAEARVVREQVRPRGYSDVYEKEYRRKDGTVFPVELRVFLIRDEGGQPVGMWAIVRDITARRAAEVETQELRRDLAHAGRVATLGELSASIAHELNQPLTAILSNAQAALRFLAAAPPALADVREILQDIVADDHRAGEIIRRLRDLTHKRQAAVAPMDVNTLVRETLPLVRIQAAARDVRLDLDLDPALGPVPCDRIQVQQVAMNLILNAVESMADTPAEARVVTVTTRREPSGPVRVSVRDQGSGIDPGLFDKLFEPFFTTKPNGLGMGLPICRSIVEAHGGRLWAENNPDRGATFHFTLAAADGRHKGTP